MLIKFIILLLRINTNIATTIKNKIETIIRFFFSLFTILINDFNKVFYLIFMKDNKIMLKSEVIKVIHKITFNKTLKINKIINYAL